MPYLIITDKEHELDRHELSAPVVVGRSPECDVVVRDVLLSRRHLKLEPEADRWVVVDLGSKNGTFIDGQKIERHVLDDADIIRAGRTRFIFRAGAFVPPPPEVVERRSSRRPADPIEALSGTMIGFELTDLEENSRMTGFPVPRPKAVEPVARRAPVAHDLVRLTDEEEPPWDLELREPAAAPAGHAASHAAVPGALAGAGSASAAIEPRPKVLRHERPHAGPATPRWLAFVYVIVAYVLCALVLWLLSWR